MKLLPETYGQASQMTVCEGPDTNAEEVGHWYSPARVAELIAAEVGECKKAVLSHPMKDDQEYGWLVSQCAKIIDSRNKPKS